MSPWCENVGFVTEQFDVKLVTGDQSYRLRVIDPSHPIHSESSCSDIQVHDIGCWKERGAACVCVRC